MNKLDTQSLINLIEVARKESKTSKKALSEAIGISRFKLWRFQEGIYPIGLEEFNAAMEFMGYTCLVDFHLKRKD